MKITPAQLRLLLTVLDEQSIGAAARRLNLTQSGASQAIIALEKALGAALLTRTRNGVAPTALALAVRRDAEIACDALARISATGRAAAASASPPLRIGCVPSIAARLLPLWCRTFRSLFPDTEISIFEGHHQEVADWVRRGIADVGLAAVAPADLAADEIRWEELSVVAPRGHTVLRGETASLAHLCHETLVTAGLGCEPILEELFAAARLPVPAIIRIQDIGTALKMVRQGIGLTILPESAFPRTDMHDLRTRRLSPHAHRRLYLLSAPERTPAGSVARLLDIARTGDAGPPEPTAKTSVRLVRSGH